MCNTCTAKNAPTPIFKVSSLKKGVRTNSLPSALQKSEKSADLSVLFPENTRNKTRSKPVKLRKSCDFCWRRKLRCEGGNPCQNCTTRNLECKHSPRKQRGKHEDHHSENESDTQEQKNDPGVQVIASQTDPRDKNALGAMEEYLYNGNDPDGALHTTLYSSAAISPSSATGLIGRTEHSYLTTVLEDFFFVFPIFKASILQEALVKFMDGDISIPQSPSFEPVSYDSSDHLKRTKTGGYLSGQIAIRDHKATCAKQAILWGCIATGALLMGSPVETASKYIHVAEAHMKECFDANDEFTADAFMTLGFMHLLLQDHAKYFRYLSFSNNLWTQLPSHRRSNLRFVYMVCGLLSHVYGIADARMSLILASLHEVHDMPLSQDLNEQERFMKELEMIPIKSDYEECNRDLSCGEPYEGSIAHNSLLSDFIIPQSMRDVIKNLITTFHTSYGTSIYDPCKTNVLHNYDNMCMLHNVFTNANEKVCKTPASPATFRIIVLSWLLFTKLALGRLDELLPQAEGILLAVEELPGLTRMTFNIHKCHTAFVVFKLLNRHDLYARLQRVHNSYCSTEFSAPSIENLSPASCSMCSSPFCRSICMELWNKLGGVTQQSVATNSSMQSNDFEIKSEPSVAPIMLPQHQHYDFMFGENFDSGRQPCWNSMDPFNGYQYGAVIDDTSDSLTAASLMSNFPNNWFDDDFQSFDQMEMAL